MLEPSGRLGRFINSVVRHLREAQSLPDGFDVSRFAGQCGHPGTHREGVREVSWVFFIFVNSFGFQLPPSCWLFAQTPQARTLLVPVARVGQFADCSSCF